jgi:hypothetical protein
MIAPAEDIARLRDEFVALKAAACAEAEKGIATIKRKAPAKYWASRMTEKTLLELQETFARFYARSIETRLAQLARINTKLGRCDPDWTLETEAQMRTAPIVYHLRMTL